MKKDKKQRTEMRLEQSIKEKAIIIGDGNLTDGVRKAVIKYKIKKRDK